MNISVQKLDEFLREHLSFIVQTVDERIRRTLIRPVPPNAESAFRIKKFRKFWQLEALAVLSYYLKDNWGVLLRVDLEELELPQLENQERLAVMLSSKEEMLTYLINSRTDRTFYGNTVRVLEQVGKSLRFLTSQPKRALKKIRRRGYRDGKSAADPTRFAYLHEEQKDWSSTELQEELNAKNAFREKALSAIRKFGMLGIRLPETEKTWA